MPGPGKSQVAPVAYCWMHSGRGFFHVCPASPGPTALALAGFASDGSGMEHIANRPDDALQDAIETALRAALGKEAPHIGVSADHGTVTLTGEVSIHTERNVAHAVALAEWGVHSVADDISVREPWVHAATDTDIARDAQAALLKADGVPTDRIVAEVSDHVLTLSGRVRSASERLAAERAVSYLQGVKNIDNRLTVNEETRTSTAL